MGALLSEGLRFLLARLLCARSWSGALCVCAITLVVLLFARLAHQLWRRTRLACFSCPPQRNWFLGHMGIIRSDEVGLQELDELIKTYRHSCAWFLGPFYNLVRCFHPDFIKPLLLASASVTFKDELFYGFMRPWLGQGLLLSNGKQWSRQRRLLTPAFHFDILKNYIHIFNNSTDIMHEKWRRLLAEGKNDFDMFDHVSLMTLDSLLKCTFSYDSHCQENCSEYISAIYELSDLVVKRQRYLPHHLDCLYKRSAEGQRFQRACKIVHDFTASVIQERRSNVLYQRQTENTTPTNTTPTNTTQTNTTPTNTTPTNTTPTNTTPTNTTPTSTTPTNTTPTNTTPTSTTPTNTTPTNTTPTNTTPTNTTPTNTTPTNTTPTSTTPTNTTPTNTTPTNTTPTNTTPTNITPTKSTSYKRRAVDFIELLLLSKDENGDGLSNEEIKAQANTFMFAGHDTTASAISWVLYNLAMHQEYQDRCRSEINAVLEGRDTDQIDWEDLPNLTFTTMCIKESMRLHPPVLALTRYYSQAMNVPGGRIVPEGTICLISIYGTHRNPDVWSNPEVFDPTRFDPVNQNQRHTYAFVPFSAGPRNCIGQNFAMAEIRVVLALTLRRFRILPGSRSPSRLYILTMKAEGGLPLTLEPLSPLQS